MARSFLGMHEWKVVCSVVEAWLLQIEMPVDKDKYYSRTKSCPLGFLIRVEGYEIHQVSRRASPPLPPTKMGDKIFNIFLVAEKQSFQRNQQYQVYIARDHSKEWTEKGSRRHDGNGAEERVRGPGNRRGRKGRKRQGVREDIRGRERRKERQVTGGRKTDGEGKEYQGERKGRKNQKREDEKKEKESVSKRQDEKKEEKRELGQGDRRAGKNGKRMRARKKKREGKKEERKETRRRKRRGKERRRGEKGTR